MRRKRRQAKTRAGSQSPVVDARGDERAVEQEAGDHEEDRDPQAELRREGPDRRARARRGRRSRARGRRPRRAPRSPASSPSAGSGRAGRSSPQERRTGAGFAIVPTRGRARVPGPGRPGGHRLGGSQPSGRAPRGPGQPTARRVGADPVGHRPQRVRRHRLGAHQARGRPARALRRLGSAAGARGARGPARLGAARRHARRSACWTTWSAASPRTCPPGRR